MALGARSTDVLRMVMASECRRGLALGTAAALDGRQRARFATSGGRCRGRVSAGGAVATLTIAAFTTSRFPARRAAGIPLQSLREVYALAENSSGTRRPLMAALIIGAERPQSKSSRPALREVGWNFPEMGRFRESRPLLMPPHPMQPDVDLPTSARSAKSCLVGPLHWHEDSSAALRARLKGFRDGLQFLAFRGALSVRCRCRESSV